MVAAARPTRRARAKASSLSGVGEVVLHRLERADRHAELLALLGVVDREVEHPLAEPDELGGGAEREPIGVVAHRVASRIGCSRAT